MSTLTIFNPEGPDTSLDLPEDAASDGRHTIKGEGDLEISFGGNARGGFGAEYKPGSLILRSHAAGTVKVRGTDGLELSGNLSYDALKDTLSGGASLGLRFSENARVTISESFGESGFETTVSVKISL